MMSAEKTTKNKKPKHRPFSGTAMCNLCGEQVGVKDLTRHLAVCRESHPATQGTRARTTFTLHVQGADQPGYFLYLEMTDNLTLDKLDGFLRDIWLECCGHMSQFIIDDEFYSARMGKDSILEDFGLPENKDIRVKAGAVLSDGLVFGHEYDFGSTTTLDLHVVNVRQGFDAPLKKPFVLARNSPPAWICADCGAPAVKVASTDFGSDAESVFCAKCAAKCEKKDGYEYTHLANSPRSGVCGYE